jgi:hypothetical protein
LLEACARPNDECAAAPEDLSSQCRTECRHGDPDRRRVRNLAPFEIDGVLGREAARASAGVSPRTAFSRKELRRR